MLRLIHAKELRNGSKDEQCSQTPNVCIKFVSSHRWQYSLFSDPIRSKETLRIMYPKYPVLDMIQRIHLRCGSFGSIIRFWILVKKRNIYFRIKNLDLDFSKETHRICRENPVDQVEFFDCSIDLCIDLISFHEAYMI